MLLSTWIGLWPFGPNVPSAFLHSRGRTGPVLAEPGNVGHGRLVSDQRSCREKRKGGRKTMRATFRRLAVATVLAAAVTTAVLPGTAEARWGWRGGGWGWGGFGVGLGTGLLLAAATRPYYAGYYGYPYYGYSYPYAYGYAPYASSYPYGYGYRRAYYSYGYYPRYRYVGYPYRRAYYRYASYYPYRW